MKPNNPTKYTDLEIELLKERIIFLEANYTHQAELIDNLKEIVEALRERRLGAPINET